MKPISRKQYHLWLETERQKRLDSQLAREEQSEQKGVTRSSTRREKEALPETKASLSLKKSLEVDVCNAFDAKLTEMANNTRRPPWFRLIYGMDIPFIADTAIRLCMDGFGKQWSFTELVMNVGEAIRCAQFEYAARESGTASRLIDRLAVQAERRGRNAEAKLQFYSDKISKIWQEPTEDEQKYFKLMADIRRDLQQVLSDYGYNEADWTDQAKADIGGLLVALVQQTHPEIWQVEYRKPKSKKRKGKSQDPRERRVWEMKYLVLSDAAQKRLEKDNESNDLLHPMFSVMEIEPRSWYGNDIAPYYSASLSKRVPFVRAARADQAADIQARMTDGRLNKVVDAVDTISRVPLVINDYTFNALKWVLGMGLPHEQNPKKLPRHDIDNKVEVPERLSKKDFASLTHAQRTKFDKRRDKIQAKKDEIKVNHKQLGSLVKEVQQLVDDDQIFFLPHNLDARGRVYHVPDFGHQRADYIRGLFMFANASLVKTEERYGDESNIQYLFLQLANTFGVKSDRGVDLAHPEKVAWVQDNASDIYDAGADFASTYDFWSKAKEPFQFLAACREWYNIVEAEQNGKDYWCGLPIGLDATQSGIQHYAASMLDKDDGNLVNLTDNPVQQDMYQVCLDRTLTIMDETFAQDTEDKASNPVSEDDSEAEAKRKAKRDKRILHYNQWSSWNDGKGLSRDDMKRNCMTWCYSSRQYGFADQIRTDIIAKEDDRCFDDPSREHHFGDDEGEGASYYLAGINQRAIEETIKSAEWAMEFFMDLTRALIREGKHLRFVTPLGFPMYQHYVETEEHQLKVFLYSTRKNKIVKDSNNFTLQQDGIEIDRTESVNAVSPNIIHAMDATHLMMTVLKCKDDGLEDIIVVHDSFSTTIGQTALLAANLRQTFYDLYKDYNLYEDLLMQVREQLTETDDEDLPELKERGSLDLQQVMKNEFGWS